MLLNNINIDLGSDDIYKRCDLRDNRVLIVYGSSGNVHIT